MMIFESPITPFASEVQYPPHAQSVDTVPLSKTKFPSSTTALPYIERCIKLPKTLSSPPSITSFVFWGLK